MDRESNAWVKGHFLNLAFLFQNITDWANICEVRLETSGVRSSDPEIT